MVSAAPVGGMVAASCEVDFGVCEIVRRAPSEEKTRSAAGWELSLLHCVLPGFPPLVSVKHQCDVLTFKLTACICHCLDSIGVWSYDNRELLTGTITSTDLPTLRQL